MMKFAVVIKCEEAKAEDIIIDKEYAIRRIDVEESNIPRLKEEICKYQFRIEHVYEKYYWEHVESSIREEETLFEPLSELKESYNPIYLLKDGNFIGVAITLRYNQEDRYLIFLADGTIPARRLAGYSETYGSTDTDDLYSYYLVAK